MANAVSAPPIRAHAGYARAPVVMIVFKVMEPENLNEEPIVNPPQQNQRSWWYYPLSWVVQLVVFTITLAIFGAGLALITLDLVDFLGFTQQHNLFVALIVYGLVVAGSVWIGLKLDKKYHFYYFISANILAAVTAVLLLTFASVFSLYGSDHESYGEQSSLRGAQMNLRATAELYYEQNNRSYKGFCESEYVQEVRTKADLITAQSKSNNHLLDCVATKESYAVEIPYFDPMQDAYLCVSANAEPVATSTSVISNAGLCGTEAIEAERVGESIVIDSRTFSWNGQTGTVLHECIRKSAEKDLLYFGPPPFNESRDISYCNQKSVLSVEFGEERVILEEFSVATTSDYKKIKGLGFTTDQFSSRRNSEFLVGATTSQNMPEKLLLSFYHDERCEWNDGVCPGGQSITHYVALPDLTIHTEPQIGAMAGRGAMKWNDERTAFVVRTYGDDIQPSFFLCVLGQSDCERYEDINLSYNRDEWNQEQEEFAGRMWDDEEIEWVSEFEVRLFDDIITLQKNGEGIGLAEYKDEELGLVFDYPAEWEIEKGKTCGYRLLTGFLSTHSRSEVRTCSDAIGPSWHIMASGVNSEYLNECEQKTNCEVVVSDYGVRFAKETTYVDNFMGPGICGEDGEAMGSVYGGGDANCKINAIYRVYRNSGDFNGFVLNTAPISPRSDEREAIIEEFEESVIKTFQFTE